MNEPEKKELTLMYGNIQGEEKFKLFVKDSDESLYITNRDEEENLINYEKVISHDEQDVGFKRSGEFYELSPNNEFIRIK